MRNGFTFEGFEPANTTPVPDFLFDVLLAHLSEAELKVLLYIIRRTSGFKKSADAISLTQFQKGIRKRATGEILDEGCGLGDRTTILKALASLEKKGCIQCERSNDPQGDKAISVYRIKFRSDGVVGKPDHPSEEGSGQTRPPWWANPTTVVGKPDYRVVGKPDLQETVLQETVLQETVLQGIMVTSSEVTHTHLIRNEYGEWIEVPADLAEKALASQRKVLDLPEPNLPDLREVVNEKLEEVEEELERITGEHPAVHPTDTESHYHIANGSAIGNEERVITPALSLPSRGTNHESNRHRSTGDIRGLPADRDATDYRGNPPGQGLTQQAPSAPVSLPLASGVADTLGRYGDTGSVQADPVSASPESAQKGSVAAAPTAQTSGFTPPKRPQLKCDPRDVQERIDAHRGYALEEKIELIRERQAVKTWCSKHTLEEYDLVMHYLTTVDKYWKLEENKFRIGGVTLAKETPKALAAMERNGKHPSQGWSAEHPPADDDYSLTAQLWRQQQRGAK